MFGLVQDITERKQAEEMLQLTNTILSSQNEATIDGILVVDDSGKIISYNRRFIEIWGIPDDVITSRSDERVLQSVFDKLFDPEEFLARVRYLYTHKEEKSREEIRLADSRILDRYSAPLIGSDGRYYGRIWHFRDITNQKKAEEEIARIAQEWEITFNATTDGICLIDADQKIQRCNNRMSEMLGGMRHEDLAGKPCWAVVHKTTGPIPACPFVSAKKTLKRTRIELPAGDLWFEVTADPVFDSSGSFAGVVHIMRDVTERKRVEEALQKSELRYRNLFNSSRDAMMSLEPPSWRFNSCNPSAMQMFMARDEAEFTSKEPWTLSPAYQPDGRDSPEKANVMIETALQKGTHFFEWTHTRLNGENFPATVLLSKTELAGKVFLQATVRDITEQKRAEEALRKSEEKFQSLYMNMIDGAALHELTYNDQGVPEDYVIIEINPAFEKQLDISRDTVIGKTSREAYGVAEPPYLEIYARVALTGEPKVFETYFPPLAKHFSISAFCPHKGSFATVFEDITERKRADEALQQANKQLNLLSSITRHDILNQLMALKGYLELSHDVIDNPTTLAEYIQKEEKAANTIEHQITFTKDYQELGAAAPAWQNVNAGINKALSGLPMRDVRVEIDPTNPELFADPLFEKVFYNLIDNALRYGSDKMKTIRVSSKESGAHLTLLCEDDGVGITAEDKKRLFTQGFGKNTGLGLFLSREILAITGITIVENGIPGNGARFEIIVPKEMWRMKGGDA
jgi:PAS domain S-box-containing protein